MLNIGSENIPGLDGFNTSNVNISQVIEQLQELVISLRKGGEIYEAIDTLGNMTETVYK